MADTRNDILPRQCNSKLVRSDKIHTLCFYKEEDTTIYVVLYCQRHPGEAKMVFRERLIDLVDTDPITTCREIVLGTSNHYVPTAKDLKKVVRIFPNVRMLWVKFPVVNFSFLSNFHFLYYLAVISSEQSHLKGIEYVSQITHLSLADGDEDDYPPREYPWDLACLDGHRLKILAINANRSCKFDGESIELPQLRELILEESCYRACKIIEIPQGCEIQIVYSGDRKAKISSVICRWKPNNEIFGSTHSHW